jgi:TolA-binding protein
LRSALFARGYRWALVAAGAALTLPPAAVASAQERARANAPSEQIDLAAKKLLSAHGKFERGLYKLAAQEYEEFLEKYPTHADATTARYALAVSRFKLGEFDKAIPLLAQVLQNDKFEQRDEALAVLGHSHLAKNEYDKALAAFDELLAKHRQSKLAEVTALNRAQTLYLANKLPEAAAAAEAYLKEFGQGDTANAANRDAATYFLALAQRGQNKNAEAAETVSRLLAASPDTPYKLDATLVQGQALEAQGKLDEAAERYRQVIQLAPPSRKADGYYSLGVALYKAGKFDEAAGALATVVNEYDKHDLAKPARLQLGLAQLDAGKTNEARRTLEEVAKSDPQRAADARYGLARTDLAERKWQPAADALEQLAAAQPAPANLPQILLDRAVALTELGKFDQAVATLDQMRQKFPKAPQIAEATYRQAFALHKLGKYAESRALSQPLAEGPKSDFTEPAAELDAENLFLLAKYPEAAKAYAALLQDAKDDNGERKLRLAFRLGGSAYHAGDFARAAEVLKPLATDDKVAQSESLRWAIFLYGDALLLQNQYAPAAEALEKYVRLAGAAEKPQAQFKLGLAQLRAGNAAAAEQALSQVASGPGDDPWVVRSLFELGTLQYKQGKKDQAAASLGRVVGAPKVPEELAGPALYLLAWTDFDAKRYEPAAERWGKMARQFPKDARAGDATYQRGLALAEAKKPAEALAAFQEYAQKFPQGVYAARARQQAAAQLTALGKNDEAMQMLAQLASDSKGASETVLYDLAWSQRGLKDTKAATETYRRILRDHPQGKLAPAVRTELAEFLYNDKNYAEAAQLLEAVLADSSADPKTKSAATYRLGWAYEKQNQSDKAAAAFAKFADENAEDPLAASALLQAGLAHAQLSHFDAAAASLSKMLQKFPQHEQAPVALLKLGEVRAEAGDANAALQAHSEFLQKYPQNEFAYRARFGVGWAHEQLKHYDEARKAYQQTIDSTNTETAARAQFQIGETYFTEGKFEEAVAALLAVEDVYAYPKWSAKALLEAGRAFEQLKQTDRAKRQYDQVLQKYKDAPEAALAQDRLKALQSAS